MGISNFGLKIDRKLNSGRFCACAAKKWLKMHEIVVFFYQSTVLSSRAVDSHQMYFEGSVIGKASTIGIEISPTPALIFTGGVG